MEGCWHSYHNSCLQDSSSCPICRNHLRSTIAKLCSTAQNAIFSPNLQGKDTNVRNDSNFDSSTVKELTEEEINSQIKKLSEEIKKLVPPKPGSQDQDHVKLCTSSSKAKKLSTLRHATMRSEGIKDQKTLQ